MYQKTGKNRSRYIGYKYEFKTGEKDYKETSMGIVLKRRDNAEIVKHCYGGVIDILMNKKNLKESVSFLQNELKNLLDGKFPLDMLVITKSLRGFYKNPNQIAHKVLADRMGIRDPGNKPSVGDRIPFVYINTKGKKVLQGDKIETPEFIKKNNVPLDYSFYISNQIMKPVQQVFALVLEDMPDFRKKAVNFRAKLRNLKKTLEPEKFEKKEMDLRNTAVKNLLFAPYLRCTDNIKKGKSFIRMSINIP